jgi:putative Ca2+/H+ antiporter (TMEM165/GDT1 family)
MEAFLISLSTVALAEIGDRTQLLTLVLITQYRRPWQIIAGIFFATLANHFAAGLIGVWFGKYLSPPVLDAVVGASLLAMAAWTLMPDKFDQETRLPGRAAFIATLIAFFVAEIGDKTQIATIALAAGYSNLGAVVAGTTLGMLVANVPIVFAGNVFAERLPMRRIHRLASGLFFALGTGFIARATWQWIAA